MTFLFGESLSVDPLTSYLKHVAHDLWEGQGKNDFQQKSAFEELKKCSALAEDRTENSVWSVDQSYRSLQKEAMVLYIRQALKEASCNTCRTGSHKDTRASHLTKSRKSLFIKLPKHLVSHTRELI